MQVWYTMPIGKSTIPFWRVDAVHSKGCGTQQRSAKNEEETAKKYMRFPQVWCKMKEEKGCEAVLCRRVYKIED